MKELEQFQLDQILKHLMDNIDVEDLLKQIDNKHIVNYVSNACFTCSQEEKMSESFDVSHDS